MVGDESLDTLVQFGRHTNVLNAVSLHPLLGLWVALHYGAPETEPFMLQLVTDPKQGTDEGQLVDHEAELLDRLDQIDSRRRSKVLKTLQQDVPPNFGEVKLIGVVSDNSISLIKKVTESLGHSVVAVLPLRPEHVLFSPYPVGTEAEETARIDNLIGTDVRIVRLESVHKCGLSFNVDN